MKLIKTSIDEDLRSPSWQMLNYNTIGNTTTVMHLDTKTQKQYKSITKFTGYNDVFGNPVIRHQDIYEI